MCAHCLNSVCIGNPYVECKVRKWPDADDRDAAVARVTESDYPDGLAVQVSEVELGVVSEVEAGLIRAGPVPVADDRDAAVARIPELEDVIGVAVQVSEVELGVVSEIESGLTRLSHGRVSRGGIEDCDCAI